MNVCTAFASIAIGLLSFCSVGRCQAWPPDYQRHEHNLVDLVGTEKGEKIDLYVKPDSINDQTVPTPPVDTDKQKEADSRRPSPDDFPSLYREGRGQGVIVIFGFPTCYACYRQKEAIPENYRVLKVNVDESDVTGGPKWRSLMSKWGIVDNTLAGREIPVYPTTVIVVNGVPVKHWTAFKPWRILEEHAEKAKKERVKTYETENDSWRPSGNRCRDNRPNRHRPKWGRWSRIG